jgi:hypothetical protein
MGMANASNKVAIATGIVIVAILLIEVLGSIGP